MKTYLILLREDIQAMNSMTEEEAMAEIGMYQKWVDELTQNGNHVSSEPLTTEGYMVSEQQVVSDGPFIEAKDAIGGYFIIKANDDQHAIEIAKSCPLVMKGGEVELRAIMEY
ncbi:MAG: YciI family protein [Marinoscillum sp.]|uniref:YciI family protein n=1 Tax=Marinoscillum sp. TaxID=2024838 RepID=UPI003304324D